MNWKLIFQLSVFGLIMAFTTVWLIPEKIEPVFWVLIFIFCAWVIVRSHTGKYFLHGFLLSLVNCIYITGVHIIFYTDYITNHPGIAKMAADHPFMPLHPRLAMLITGPVFGIICGIILGLFTLIASKLTTKKVAVR